MPKPNIAVMLGIGGKPKSESGPPPFGGSKEPDMATEPEGDEGCGFMCPKCGAALEVKGSEEGQPGMDAEPMADDMGDSAA